MAASSSTLLLHSIAVPCSIILVLLTSTHIASGCFKSLISFGDSLADTGNSIRLFPSDNPPPYALPPYGRSFFHNPTGRCSDGRIVIDFIAESFGLPLVSPYFGRGDVNGRDFGEGVNFAVVGAPALDDSFFKERGISNPYTNISLGNQLDWFKEMLASSCQRSSDCKELFPDSLILMGEIGGNDYNNALLEGKSIEEVQTFVPLVVGAISSAINELIKLGAVTMVVPGILPVGCLPYYLTLFQTSDSRDYDNYGCIKWLNKFTKYHNEMLQIQLSHLREIHPHATIIYADYYNAATRLYHSPNEFGFTAGRVLKACCGDGGPYNYNSSAPCGKDPSTCCDEPSVYICWDGLHLTEAAYRWIARGLLQGPYANPPLNSTCASLHRGINHELLFQD